MPRNSPRLSPEKKRHSSIGPSLKKKGLHKSLPQWIFSKGVLQHVPPGELGEFFENLASVMHPETVGVLRAQMGSKNEQTSAKSWLHTIEDLQRAAHRSASTSRSINKSRSGVGFPCEPAGRLRLALGSLRHCQCLISTPAWALPWL
jgi:hypothetical protein